MKVAVISNPEQSGKSAFCIILASLFARTQLKSATVFSTAEASDVLKTVQIQRDKSIFTSASILEAALQGDNRNDRIFDYGFKVGEEECYIFDVYDSTYDRQHLDNVLLQIVKLVKSPLTLIEVKGDLDSDVNQQVLESADAILYLFTTSSTSMDYAVEYQKKYNWRITAKTGYVCSKYNPNILGEKLLSKKLGMSVKNIMLFPYNTLIAKESIEGTLDTIVKFIVAGYNEVLNLRPKLLEVMQYLFDTPSVKYIRGVEKWRK